VLSRPGAAGNLMSCGEDHAHTFHVDHAHTNTQTDKQTENKGGTVETVTLFFFVLFVFPPPTATYRPRVCKTGSSLHYTGALCLFEGFILWRDILVYLKKSMFFIFIFFILFFSGF